MLESSAVSKGITRAVRDPLAVLFGQLRLGDIVSIDSFVNANECLRDGESNESRHIGYITMAYGQSNGVVSHIYSCHRVHDWCKTVHKTVYFVLK